MSTYSCHATALRQTDGALLVELESGEEVWVPQSVIDEDSEVYEEGHEGDLVVSDWFARKQGWT